MITKIQSIQAIPRKQQPAFGKGEHWTKSALTGIKSAHVMSTTEEGFNLIAISDLLKKGDYFTKTEKKSAENIDLHAADNVSLHYNFESNKFSLIKRDSEGDYLERMIFYDDKKHPSISSLFERVKQEIIQKAGFEKTDKK